MVALAAHSRARQRYAVVREGKEEVELDRDGGGITQDNIMMVLESTANELHGSFKAVDSGAKSTLAQAPG